MPATGGARDRAIKVWISTNMRRGTAPRASATTPMLLAGNDIPHGHTSCIMLPAVMRWNKPANGDRQVLVATAMGRPGEDAADVLDAFIAGLGMPRSLTAVGIRAEHFDRIAEGAMATPWVPRNPRPIAGPVQIKEILDLAA